MIYLKNLKKDLKIQARKLTEKDFLQSHRFVEGYSKRLLLIGLRLRGVRYRVATRATEAAKIFTDSTFKKAFELITDSKDSFQNIIEQNVSLKALWKLFREFARPHRNSIIHGSRDSYSDQSMLKYLVFVDKAFIWELDKAIQCKYGNSAFDKPTQWLKPELLTWLSNESKRSQGLRLSFSEVIRHFSLGGQPALEPMRQNKVLQLSRSVSISVADGSDRIFTE